MPKITSQNTSFASKRAQVLKRCNTNIDKQYVGTKLDTTEQVDIDSPISNETYPEKCKMMCDEALDISIYKKRGGEHIPKVIRRMDKKQVNVTGWLHPMRVVYSDLGENGNLGKFTEDVSKAKFAVTLEAAAPDNIPSLGDKIIKDAEKDISFVKDICDKAMGVAFHDENTWKSQKRGIDDDQTFIQNAQHSIIKTIEGDDGEKEVISLTRRLEGFHGEPNRPVFWRLREDDTPEQVHPKFIRRGAILKVQVTFRAYQIPGGRYGVAGDLGKHILIVYSPPKEEKQKKSVEPEVPYIPFDL